MSFQVVTEFERNIAHYFGAPYAVAFDSCTHGIEVCLRYTNATSINVPKRTYISIPFLANKIGIELEWRNEEWQDYFKTHQPKTLVVWGAGRRGKLVAKKLCAFKIDFVCVEKQLIVEIDGEYHPTKEQEEAEALKIQFLHELGYKIIRYTSEEVIGDTNKVIQKISSVIARLPLRELITTPPHILVMTATPIPRTLAMSVYGDLDISVIDELPPGRKEVKTVHRYDRNRLGVFKFMKDEIAKGRQIYVVYPLIEESEAMDYKDLMDGYESISREFPSPHYQISIVHGKMKPSDKEYEMQRFVKGETHIMVATTVIEVGVNVPNASVMVIESAERFGLSQLHQLRGRVGRGADQSYCILLSSFKLSEEGKTRLQTMVETSDGFKIAEVDLKLRGPGNIMGTQQSGVLNLKIADVIKDSVILASARSTAIALLQEDADLSNQENFNTKKAFIQMSKTSKIWSKIS